MERFFWKALDGALEVTQFSPRILRQISPLRAREDVLVEAAPAPASLGRSGIRHSPSLAQHPVVHGPAAMSSSRPMDTSAHVLTGSSCISFYLPLSALKLDFLGQEKNAKGNEICGYVLSLN